MSEPHDWPRIPRRARPAVQRVVLRLAYDGAGFRGFQRQPGVRTVEGVLVDRLRSLGLTGGLGFASRTDAGVHAIGQVVAFRAPADRPVEGWAAALAEGLPPELRVVAVAVAPAGFHPRWSAAGKRYVYRLTPPLDADAWRLPATPDLEPGRLASALEALRRAPALDGFTAAGAPPKPAPPLARLVLGRAADTLVLELEGPAFRRYAIRHLVGALVLEASGGAPAGHCAQVAAAPPPYRGPRAPAGGLTLEAVYYPPGLDPFPPARPPDERAPLSAGP